MAPSDSSPLVQSAVDLRSAGSSGELRGLELSHLGRYVLIGAVIAGCLMVSAWSRIDLRGTAVALDEVERAHASAEAEQARLQLELATLREPARLRSQASALGLSNEVTVVDLSEVSAH